MRSLFGCVGFVGAIAFPVFGLSAIAFLVLWFVGALAKLTEGIAFSVFWLWVRSHF
ncbi:MAG: hypothetical protein F6K62_22630 [Sphaerospermopsis sp. SIO1G2]|nr:hypothetical protein [Sphaerospermopsis sp. SIO1G2]